MTNSLWNALFKPEYGQNKIAWPVFYAVAWVVLWICAMKLTVGFLL